MASVVDKVAALEQENLEKKKKLEELIARKIDRRKWEEKQRANKN